MFLLSGVVAKVVKYIGIQSVCSYIQLSSPQGSEPIAYAVSDNHVAENPGYAACSWRSQHWFSPGAQLRHLQTAHDCLQPVYSYTLPERTACLMM
jgi:hypothetical protein